MTNFASKTPFDDASFAHQRYVARAGIMDLFSRLEVSGSLFAELARAALSVPLQQRSLTTGGWLAEQAKSTTGVQADAAKKGVVALAKHAQGRMLAGGAWLETQAYLIIGEGNQSVGRVCARILAKAWDGLKKFLAEAMARLKIDAKSIREIASSPQALLREALKMMISLWNKTVSGLVDPFFKAEAAVFQLGDMVMTTITEVLHRFGPMAFGNGIPQEINNGLYLARGISALLSTANLANAASAIVQKVGVTIAWPARVVADIAGCALTLIVRLSEAMRLRKLAALAREHASEFGYLANGKFTLPDREANALARGEARFVEFFDDHIRWFPAAAALCILVPHGLSHPSIYLNLGGDKRYRAPGRGGPALDTERFNLGDAEIEKLRRDARLYLKAIGLKFKHPEFNIDAATALHFRDEIRPTKSILHYLTSKKVSHCLSLMTPRN